MPRKLRLQFEGAIYHVMSRGNARQDIVADDRDRAPNSRATESNGDTPRFLRIQRGHSSISPGPRKTGKYPDNDQ